MKIITDEKLLRVECEDVLPHEINDLRKILEESLEESSRYGRPGIGLAAPQIGFKKKMAIIRIPATKFNNKINIDLVNCSITDSNHIIFVQDEGCLSFPGEFARTQRFNEIFIEDNEVEPHSFIATGLAAICCQHELDHLKGVLLSDVALNW